MDCILESRRRFPKATLPSHVPLSSGLRVCRDASIDVAADKITRSLRKMKEKAVKKGQWPGRGYAKGAVGIKDVAPEEDLGRLSMDEPTDGEVESATARLGSLPASIKRTKVFYLDPMTVEVRHCVRVTSRCLPCRRGAGMQRRGARQAWLQACHTVELVQEAVDQLDLVDHDFYLYLDKASGHVQAVYKRQAGGHGVIITIPDEITV